MQRLRAQQVFVEDDMVVFGYGGFYERPKGWGLDLCYFHKHELAWWRGRRGLFRRIGKAMKSELHQGALARAFATQLVRRLQRVMVHEWHYDRAELMFQAAKMGVPSLARHNDFASFARMVLTGAFCTPEELETRVADYLRTLVPHENPLVRVDSQNYLLFGFLLKAMQADLEEWLGVTQGEWLSQQLVALATEPPRNADSLEDFISRLLDGSDTHNMLMQWHSTYFAQLTQHPPRIWQSLRKLRVARPNRRAANKARKVTLAEARQALPPELPALLSKMDIPFFVATGIDLGYFRDFHQPGYLVYRQTGAMHRMIGMGLCVHRSRGKGGIFLTHTPEQPARFSHTLMEECTHFADGPQDRMRLAGNARYSGAPAFAVALKADMDLHAPWRNSKVLGLREWGLILTQMHVPARKLAKLQLRIEAYGATLDFRHYAEEERLAEVFAALPVIEGALGRKLAQAALPHMMGYYERNYRAGLREELAALTS